MCRIDRYFNQATNQLEQCWHWICTFYQMVAITRIQSGFPAFHLKCPVFFAYFELEKCALLSVKRNSDHSGTSFQCLAKLIRSAEL